MCADDAVATTRAPVVLRPEWSPATALPLAYAWEPDSASIGDIETIRSSESETTPENCAEYRPDGDGSILNVATWPRLVPTNKAIEE